MLSLLDEEGMEGIRKGSVKGIGLETKWRE